MPTKAPTTSSQDVRVALPKQLVAEGLGTLGLVFGGVGAAVLATSGPSSIGWLGVALAFGLTVLVGAYAYGPISGGHFNPAVTVGLWVAGRFSGSRVLPYIAAQIVGGALGSSLVYLICRGGGGTVTATTARADGFGANGFGAHSPMGFDLGAGALAEVIATFLFVMVIIGATSKLSHNGQAGLAIGLALTLLLLVTIPITNGSLNPARSIAAAIFAGHDGSGHLWAWRQLWVFLIFPTVGGALAGAVHRYVLQTK
ncbi:MAG: aquaporin [Propionibacteriaceae bacterium]|nr:aquaporin [Propionibacteriaceae bacterium]